MEKIIKYSIRTIIVIVVAILLYFLFSTEGGNSSESVAEKKKREQANELSILFGGGSANASEDDKSIFESDFYKAGKVSYEEGGNIDSDSEGRDNPINPQTGKPYDEEAMQQFDQLRKQFPTNDLIPKKLTEEQKATKLALDEKIVTAAKNVFANTASKEDTKLHFDHKLKQAKDRMEIIDYLINQKGMAAEDSEEASKVKQIFETIKSQYTAAEEERKQAFAKAGVEDYPLENMGKR